MRIAWIGIKAWVLNWRLGRAIATVSKELDRRCRRLDSMSLECGCCVPCDSCLARMDNIEAYRSIRNDLLAIVD